MTNYDKITSMDDDDLAATICDMIGECSKCPGVEMCMMGIGKANGLKMWMRLESDEE